MPVEEIFNYLWYEGDGADFTWRTDVERLAEKMYNDGWRKQKEGKWIPASTKPGVYAGMKCSECRARITYSEYNNGQHLYCHKCGAKMLENDNVKEM